MSTVVAIALVGYIIGLPVGALCLRVYQDMAQASATEKSIIIGLRRFEIGTDEFSISTFKVENQCYMDVGILSQMANLQNVLEKIVWLIVAYDLKWFQTGEFRGAVQEKVDDFVVNIEKYNEYMKRPGAKRANNPLKASIELKEANQPIVECLEKLKKEIDEYIEIGGYKLVNFES